MGPTGVDDLLRRANHDASEAARRDLASSLVDRRAVTLLEALTRAFRIRVSLIKTGHPMGPLSPAGRENDHYFFRAFDITAVDGMAIAEAPAARAAVALGNYLVGLEGNARPARVMGPGVWLDALDLGDRTGFPADPHARAIHADHIHIGFAPLTVGGAVG